MPEHTKRPPAVAVADPPETAILSLTLPLAAAADDFGRSQRAANRSPKTIKLYRGAIDGLARFLTAQGMPADVETVRREHLEAWMVDRLAHVASSTANMEYRAVARFFGWAVEEDIIPVSPMDKMHPPRVGIVPVPVLAPADVQSLIDACRGREYADRRDMAIVWLLLDCGLRRAEVGNLGLADVDREHDRVYVTGKGSKGRFVSYGPDTAKTLDGYLRARARHPLAGTPALFLGRTRRPFGPSGVGQVLAVRSRQAGLGRVNPHRLRHTFAHTWLASGGNETDLMSLAGWSSRQMLSRYGASAAGERAAAAQRKNSVGSRMGVKL